MAEYRVMPGTFSVTPTKSSYASGEEVELLIKCKLQRKNGWGAWLTWFGDYAVYKKGGKELVSISQRHLMAPWTDIDTAEDNFPIKIGTFSPGVLEGYVTVSAHG